MKRTNFQRIVKILKIIFFKWIFSTNSFHCFWLKDKLLILGELRLFVLGTKIILGTKIVFGNKIILVGLNLKKF